MTKGAKEGSKHFEDVRMNPRTQKGHHAKEPTKEQTQQQLDAIARNVQGKTGT